MIIIGQNDLMSTPGRKVIFQNIFQNLTNLEILLDVRWNPKSRTMESSPILSGKWGNMEVLEAFAALASGGRGGKAHNEILLETETSKR